MNLRALFFLSIAITFCIPAQAETPCLFNPSNGRY